MSLALVFLHDIMFPIWEQNLFNKNEAAGQR